MWQLKEPSPVKLIIGILAANQDSLQAAIKEVASEFGKADFVSDITKTKPAKIS
jgi:mannitol/fructose-specific phosphotransferase system IIA component